LRAQNGVPANKKLKIIFDAPADMEAREKEILKLLAGAESVEHRPGYQPGKGEAVAHGADGGKLFLPMAGLVDAGAEKARLTKELEKMKGEIEKAQQKLNNPAFTQKAPPAVLEEHRKRLADWEAKRAQLQAAFEALGAE
jgi:valyl-tRNA synthetase